MFTDEWALPGPTEGRGGGEESRSHLKHSDRFDDSSDCFAEGFIQKLDLRQLLCHQTLGWKGELAARRSIERLLSGADALV